MLSAIAALDRDTSGQRFPALIGVATSIDVTSLVMLVAGEIVSAVSRSTVRVDGETIAGALVHGVRF